MRPIHDVAQQNVETVDLGRCRWGECRNRRVAQFGDLSYGAGRIWTGNYFHTHVEQVAFRLRERLGVRAHFDQVLNQCPGNPEDRMPHLHEMLGHDRKRLVAVATGESVEHGEHRTGGGVLNRNNQPVDGPFLECGEGRGESDQSDGFTIGEQLSDGSVAVRARLTLISNTHGVTIGLPRPTSVRGRVPRSSSRTHRTRAAIVAASIAGRSDAAALAAA